MDFTTGSHTDLYPILNNVDLAVGLDDGTLEAALIAVNADLHTALPSYLGLQLRVVEQDHPVIWTAVSPDETARTSLRLALLALGPGFDSRSHVTFYAATPGAFVDLAADLSFALHLTPVAGQEWPSDGGRLITVDTDLPASHLVPGVSGLDELSTINRAIGLLIGRGHHPDLAGQTLRRAAARRGLAVHAYAARLLGRSDCWVGPTEQQPAKCAPQAAPLAS